MNGSEPNSPETTDAPSGADTGKAAAAPGEWKMPEPVFKQTSGYLPQGYIEQFGAGVPKQAEGPATETPAAETPAAALSEASGAALAPAPVDIEPQPDLIEQLEDQPVQAAPAAPVKKKGGVGRIIMIVLGIGLMIAFLVVFLALVYFLFISPESSEGIF